MKSNSDEAGVAMSPDNRVESSNRGRKFTIPHPIVEEEHHQDQCTEEAEVTTKSGLMGSIRKFFAPCVGAIDAASVYIAECRPLQYETCNIDHQENTAEDVIMRLRERNRSLVQTGGKRRNETLVIPSNSLMFDDDDVSAISAHTLEEMEKLRAQMAQNNKLPKFFLSPQSSGNNSIKSLPGQQTEVCNNQTSSAMNLSVSTQTRDNTHEGNLSICGSASDSSNSQEVEPRKSKCSKSKPKPPSWSKDLRKDQGFKTHPVG